MRGLCLLLSLLTTLLPAAGMAATSAELLDNLRTAIKEEISADRAVSSRNPNPSTHSLEFYLSLLEKSISGKQELEQYLDVISRLDNINPHIVELCAQVREQSMKEREEAAAQFGKAVDDVAAEARAAALAAKTDRDLDPVVEKVAALRPRIDSAAGPNKAAVASRLDALTRSLSRWQDYLAQSAAGNWQEAASALQNVGEGSGLTSLAPRSEILQRINAAKEAERKSRPQPTPTPDPDAVRLKIEAILATLKEPAQLSGVIDQITALRRDGRSYSDDGVWQELAEINALYTQVRQGIDVPPELMARTGYSGSGRRFAELRMRVILLGLPHALGLPPDSAAKPDENIGAFLDRIASEAKARRDWPLLLRAAQVRAGLMGMGEGRGSLSLAGMQSLAVASNREAAGQFTLAVMSYQDALKDTTGMVPVDFVRERLESIQRDHGKEFDEGMKQYALKPRSPYPYLAPVE